MPERVDALINCAGLPNGGRFTPDQIVAVNWFGLRMLTEGVLPKMPEGSSVVPVASTAARNWQLRQPELAELLSIESFTETMFLADELSSSFVNGVNLTLDRGVKAARIMGAF